MVGVHGLRIGGGWMGGGEVLGVVGCGWLGSVGGVNCINSINFIRQSNLLKFSCISFYWCRILNNSIFLLSNRTYKSLHINSSLIEVILTPKIDILIRIISHIAPIKSLIFILLQETLHISVQINIIRVVSFKILNVI